MIPVEKFLISIRRIRAFLESCNGLLASLNKCAAELTILVLKVTVLADAILHFISYMVALRWQI